MPVAMHDTETLVRQAQGARVVLHALNPPYTHKAWREQAVGLMDAAIAVARALQATLMWPGNVYNYGEAMPPVLHETTPQQAKGFKGRLRIELEQRLANATQDGGMRAVVLRAGDFFGSGTGSWLDQAIAKDLPRGRVTWPGPLDVTTSWAYLPDLARTFVRVAQERERLAAFECLQFAGHAVSGQQWVHSLSAAAAERGWLPASGALRVSRLNWTLLRVAGLALPTFQALAAMRYLWHTPYRLDNTRLRALIGDEPRTAFDQAVEQALADLGLGGQPATRAAWA
jgi:nucleoside-diphosphate-sugar epimerase